MVEDAVDDGIVGDEGDDAHLALALGTGERVCLIDLTDQLGPAPLGNLLSLLFDDQELMLSLLSLVHLAPMSIGIEAKVTDHDLAFVGDVRGYPGDKLLIIHPLQIFGFFSILVAYLALRLIKRESLERKHRTDHVFAHPLGLLLGGNFDLAVDREA